MTTPDEYRPVGAVGIPDWDRCWAAGNNRWRCCDRYGHRDQLGLCDEHFEEIRRAD